MSVDTNVFEPIEHSSVVESIVGQIEELILLGVLKDAARLPSERDLAEKLGVSRPKLREALKILDEKGLIVTRHGDGTFISKLIGSAMSPALIELYTRHSGAFIDYLDFRLEQETFASSLAAERATEADRAILTKIIRDMDAAHEANNIQASQEADIAFHSAIVDAGHNTLMIHTMSSIYALTRRNLFYNRAFLRAIDGTGDMLYEQHKTIYRAIMEGDREGAAAAAAAHINFVKRSYEVSQSRDRRERTANRRMALIDAEEQ